MDSIRGTSDNSTSRVHTGDACGRRRSIVSVQRLDHLHVHVQRRELVAEPERRRMPTKRERVASFAKDF